MRRRLHQIVLCLVGSFVALSSVSGCGRVGFDLEPSPDAGIDSSIDGAIDSSSDVSSDSSTDTSDVTPETCTDNVLNQDEEDIDCGGTHCAACEDPFAFALELGGRQSCFLRTTGAIRCWGDGSHGRLGYGDYQTVGDTETPASKGDVEFGSLVSRVSTGGHHTCGVSTSGVLRCWGWNDNGQLGYASGVHEMVEKPVNLSNVDVGGEVKQVSTGSTHTCALLTNGHVRCWGNHLNGRLGYVGQSEDVGDNETPASKGDVDVGGTVIQITAGQSHTCALLDTGNVRCWGEGLEGKLGYNATYDVGYDQTPASMGDVNVGGTVVQIAAGSFHTCALLNSGDVRCWGKGQSGQLGYELGYISSENIGDTEHPASKGNVDIGGKAVQIAAGGIHTCALLDTGNVRCWGLGQYGRLGYNGEDNIGDTETPAFAGDVEVGGTVIEIAAGGAHTCALLDTAEIRCWGEAANGKLGTVEWGDIGDDETPGSVPPVSIE